MDENIENTENIEQTESTTPSNNKMFLYGGIVVVAVLVIGGLFLLKGKGGDDRGGVTTEMNEGTTNEEMSDAVKGASDSAIAQTDDKNAKVFNIEAGSFYFKPNVMKVKKGDTVKVVLTNKEGFHDFVIDEFNVKSPKLTESGTTVTFVADKAGTFEFYCSVGKHRQMGMKGNLIVE